MIGNWKTTRKTISGKRPEESGVALLTVLALLSIFAVILAGFTYSLRMEEFSVRTYGETVNVEKAAQAAVQGVLSQVARDLDPFAPHYILGRPQPRYISQLDPWYVGYAGRISGNVAYDARSHILDSRVSITRERRNARFVPTPIPLGVDEDHAGDTTGTRDLEPSQSIFAKGDGYPGLQNVDDNLDGVVDHDFNNDGRLDSGYSPFDDDEDFLIDEDPFDVRRPDLKGSNTFFAPGTGYDQDGDRLGVFDESSKINLNFAGNTSGRSGDFTYNLGVSPAELDLPVFLYNRAIDQSAAVNIASYIVNFRHGSIDNGGQTRKYPGVDRQDDNNNSDPEIFEVKQYDEVFETSQFDEQPFVIIGNNQDDDQDGLMDEEDERYIGPTTFSSAGTATNDPIQTQSNSEDFRPGDKIDNNGDTFIDEDDEGIDDPSEFNITNPIGDDHPFSSIEELKLISGIGDVTFLRLKDVVTIYSEADQISGPLSGRFKEIAKINPNSLTNWRATPYWDPANPQLGNVDVQYSPPIRVEDLLALQVDNDGDWQLEAEPDVKIGKPDGIDNDGDGLVDEPSDDWDQNFFPSGDFDTLKEPDVASPFTRNNNRDDDMDGFSNDGRYTGTVDTVGDMRILTRNRQDTVDRDVLGGMNVEGDGQDNDGDGLIDDDGDFNNDGLLSYDPEWHVSEDAFGDQNADGYPGLGGSLTDPDDEDIIDDPRFSNDLLLTSYADDDWDGFADFNDPQVLAAMLAPEMDGVDNDSDGEVDEIGERYIAAYDDDEDGRMDEDPPEFQIALNLVDFIDTWGPGVVANDPDVRSVLGIANDNDPVIVDGVTRRTFSLYSSRQRAFRMNPRLTSGFSQNSRESRLYTELMRFLLPNPPETGMNITYEGVEAIRINEVMAKPVIRLEMEEALGRIDYDSSDSSVLPEIVDRGTFEVLSGDDDDGAITGFTNAADTSWGRNMDPTPGGAGMGFSFLPEGFKNTLNPYVPITNMDTMSPAFVFSVTNFRQIPGNLPPAGTNFEESAKWTFSNLPNGVYDVVVYLHPSHEYFPHVDYEFNGEPITFRSDYRYQDVVDNNWTAAGTAGYSETWLRYDIARYLVPGSFNAVTHAWDKDTFALPYRLSVFPPADRTDFLETTQRVEITGNQLEVVVTAREPVDRDWYATSIDRIELINLSAQYVELVNISNDDIDLTGWTVNTPYGHYILPKDTVIKRMKPAWEGDDDNTLPVGEGLHGTAVPFEPMLEESRVSSNTISSEDVKLENNKLLLAFDRTGLISFIQENYNADNTVLQQQVVEPVLSTSEQNRIDSDPVARERLHAQPLIDKRFRVVDVQDDILTHNPQGKHITLYNPAGGYVDRFEYRTTFNNLIVDIPNVGAGLDLIALPGYQGFESFERTDPTYFENESIVTNLNVSGGKVTDYEVSVKRSVPSSLKLDVKDAIVSVAKLGDNGELTLQYVAGYSDQDRNNPGLVRHLDRRLPSDPLSGHTDPVWNGWDFIGDHYVYPSKISNADTLAAIQSFEGLLGMSREAVAPKGMFAEQSTRFFQALGGFENITHVDRTNSNALRNAKENVTIFTWRKGLRELIRAGYDMYVDDQLTVRVLGRQYVAMDGVIRDVDMPVGEVMTTPAFRVIDPGQSMETNVKRLPEIIHPRDPQKQETFYRDDRNWMPVFTKLRHGDTAFTVDLRNDLRDLTKDLLSDTEVEPQIEISVVIRKTTPDYSPGFVSSSHASPQAGYIYPEDRPDLDMAGAIPGSGIVGSNSPAAPGIGFFGALGSYADDNYFFKGIELFGRSSKDQQEISRYLAGTPLWDNSGYVPAYPRRRSEIAGRRRDRNDIIDNTAYVKNGQLATIGELSRLYTGNKFETINTPIIPQRLEDRAVDMNRVLTNAELGSRSMSNDEARVQLAQRERLDQWENQYMQLYNMITTSLQELSPGLININTAQREVLMALPFTPLVGSTQGDFQLDTLINRHNFNAIVADYILEGRQPGGHDMYFGVQDVNDDQFIEDFNKVSTQTDTQHDYKLNSTGREIKYYKDFDDIQKIFNDYRLSIQDVRERRVSQFKDFSLSTIVSAPDDGPFSDLGTLFSQITHLKRRERFSEALRTRMDRNWDNVDEMPGDLRERLNDTLRRDLTPEDMEEMMNRISNLVTVRSRTFSIITRGRVFDENGNVLAQRKLETVYKR